MNRWTDRNWVWIGIILGGLYPLGYAKLPDVGLLVLSIFFSGLLAISRLIPIIQDYKQIKFIKKSGHMKDLVNYINLPLWLSFTLIILELANKIIIIPEKRIYIQAFTIVSLSLWGVFICSLCRIVVLVPKLINDT